MSKLYKVLASLLVLISIIVVSIIPLKNGQMLQFGEKAHAAVVGDTMYLNESSIWTDTGGRDVNIPIGFVPLGYDSAKGYFYIINLYTGEIKRRTMSQSTWSVVAQFLYPVPDGYVPLGVDGSYYYIMNLSTGDVKYRYVGSDWTEYTTIDVPVPNGYVPLYMKPCIDIINIKTGDIKTRALTSTSWSDKGGTDKPIPTGYVPYGYISGYLCIIYDDYEAYANRFSSVASKDTTITNDPYMTGYNFPVNQNIFVSRDPSFRRVGLMYWDTSSIPKNSKIISAEMLLYSPYANTNSYLDIFKVTTEWQEATVTYSTAPNVSIYNYLIYNSDNPWLAYYSGPNIINVTSLVQDWISNSSNRGVYLSSPSYDCQTITLYSRECDTIEYRPKLLVTYVVPPTISASKPTGNEIYTETDTGFIPQFTAYDPDSDILNCKYYIDSETTPRGTKTISNTRTSQVISFNSLNMSTLNEGTHTIRYEVSDGITDPVTKTVSFKVDKSAPALGTIAASSTISSITLSGSAADAVAGLYSPAYGYTKDSGATYWTNATSYTWGSLTPNTPYSLKFQAKDNIGHISTSTRTKYTLADNPKISISNIKSYELDLTITDINPATTQYQIWTGSSYLTSTGYWSSTPQWITLTNKKITVKGLSASSTYTLTAKARNGEYVETTNSASVSGTTLVAPPPTPTNFRKTTVTQTSISLAWDVAAGATGYDLEIDGGATPINVTGTSYTHSGLLAGTTHTYRVRAKNGGNPSTSGWTTALSIITLPSSPVLTVTPSETAMNAVWNSVSGATVYQLFVNDSVRYIAPDTTYSHTGFTPNTQYSYYVCSNNASGWSPPSPTISKYTLANVPSNGSVGTTTNSSIAASWSANGNPNGTSYMLAVFNASDVLIKQNAWTTSLSGTITALTADTIYKVKVKAKNGDGVETSWYTINDAARTLPNAPDVPAGLTGSSTSSSITINWSPANRATAYDIKRDGVMIKTGVLGTSYTDEGLLPETSYRYTVQAKNTGGASGYCSEIGVSTLPNPPETPTGLVADGTTETITVKWTAASKASGYKLEIDGTDIIDTGNMTTYTHGSLKGTQHTYRLRAYNTGGESGWTEPLNAATLLDTPGDLTASASDTRILLTWGKVEGATGYEITLGGITYTTIDTSYECIGLSPSTAYPYKVRAANDVSNSLWSEERTKATLPSAPSVPAIQSTIPTMTAVTVNWGEVQGATGYDIIVDGQLITDVRGTSYVHTGLIPGTGHTYKVRARNSGGKSMWSGTAAVNTLPAPPNVPINIDTSSTMDTITLVWDPVEGADSYQMEINGQDKESTSVTRYVYGGLEPSTGYVFRIRSIDQGQPGDWSEMVLASTRANDYGIPGGLSTTSTDTAVTVTWQAVEGASGYMVQVDGAEYDVGLETTYVHMGLSPDTRHTYRVRARYGEELGDWSSPVSEVTHTLPPQSPSGVNAKGGENLVTLAWNPVLGITSYDIEIDGTTLIENITGTTYTHEGLLPSEQHTYRLRSKDRDNMTSEWSSTLSVTTLAQIPPVPQNIVSEDTNRSIVLAWDSTEGTESYDVEMDGTEIRSTIENRIVHENLEPDSDHTYRIRSVRGDKVSEWSGVIEVSTLPDRPVTPSGISVTAGVTEITVGFEAVEGVDSYEIQVDDSIYSVTEAAYKEIGSLMPESQHVIRVRAMNAGGYSDWSSGITVMTMSAVPGIPSVKEISSTQDSVTLVWNSIQGATGYEISVDGVTVKIGTDTQYIDTGLSPGTRHTYRVRAINAGGYGDWSGEISKTTSLGVPVGVAASPTGGAIKLTWSAVEGTDTYELEMDGKVVATVTEYEYTQTDVMPNHEYTYRVRAKNPLTTGGWSAPVHAEVPAPACTMDTVSGQEFEVSFSARDVEDIQSARFVITYNPDEVEILDLCNWTPGQERTAGVIEGTNIQVVQIAAGRIVLRILDSSEPGETWSGTIDVIAFRSKVNGKVDITFNIV